MDMNSPQYQSTLDYLYSFVDYSLQKNLRNAPGLFDLGRMRAFTTLLGDPQLRYPIIHVAGTKGKGSVSAMCASVLHCAGYRVGLYTSPHLVDYAERIQVDGKPIPHDELVLLVDELRPKIQSIPQLSTFEITTGLAFLYFARQGVNAAVIEVGLGGRLDATNVVEPIVSVITSLSYDHMSLLGNTLTEIAGEKAGIIKQGVPVVISPQKDEARVVVERVAAEHAAPVIQVGKDYRYNRVSHSLDSQLFSIYPEGEAAVQLTISLLGYHQIENAATAYAALRTAGKDSLSISREAIVEGFAQASWPGRFEVLRREPPVVIDSAHNRDSALRLRESIDDYFPDLPVVLLFGASEDKDVEGMFTELMPRVRQLIAVKSFHPRAMPTEALIALAQRYGKPARSIPDVPEGLETALYEAGADALLLVTGSIFVVAGVRMAWQARQSEKSLNLP